MLFIKSFFLFLKYMFYPKTMLIIENISLRQQLAVQIRSNKRPKLTNRDRLFMVLISKLHSGWRSFLAIVQPATVIAWHRRLFKFYWRWKSRKKGRPEISPGLIAKIKQLSKENPLWSAERIRDFLILLGFENMSVNSVRKYMVKVKRTGQPSGTWLAFLRNHGHKAWGIDFFTVPTITFDTLYCFVILDHASRKAVHFAVTYHPSMEWVIQQLRNATPFGQQPKYLFRDNDQIYGDGVRAFLDSSGINEVRTAFRSPWQNPFVERFIGTLRRDLLDYVIVFDEQHLHNLLKEYIDDYYHIARPHQGLNRDTPSGFKLSPPQADQPGAGKNNSNQDKLIPIPVCGGLHHRYKREVA